MLVSLKQVRYCLHVSLSLTFLILLYSPNRKGCT